MWFLLSACISAPSDDTAAPPAANPFSVLTYNVHGLPPEITGDDTAARIEQIGPLLSAFDVVGVQEDWLAENHEVLVEGAGFANVAWDDTVVIGRAYGAGITTLTDLPHADYQEVAYDQCYGVLDGASDCLASKGFQVTRLRLSESAEADWYNTHLEAGSGDEDNAARALDVEQLIASMNGYSEGRAVLFTGDTNLDLGDPEDEPVLDEWIAAASLRDACTEIGCAEPDHIDRIFLRDGSGVKWAVEAWNREEGFVDSNGVDLSDHPAISVSLRWE